MYVRREDIDLNSKDKCGFTGLHWACYGGEPMISMLIENAKVFKIDPMVKDNNGKTFLQLAKNIFLRNTIVLLIILKEKYQV